MVKRRTILFRLPFAYQVSNTQDIPNPSATDFAIAISPQPELLLTGFDVVGGAALDWLLLLPAGVSPPSGYVFVGSTQMSLRPTAAMANKQDEARGGAEVRLTVNVYRKQ